MGNDLQIGLDWLYSTQLFGIKLGLENVHRLLAALELPGPNQKFIHVAGTNGKGSTCAFLHALLRQGGINAGLFTSPHLIRFNERIQDGERCISDEEVEAGLARLRALVADWQPHPTFFELTFALALDWFRARGLEWVVLETGLGGRLDATNAIIPQVAVITSISLDHTEILGDTVAQIAAEKAGIIKPGVPVVTQPQDPAAQQILAEAAAAHSSAIVIAGPWPGADLGLPGEHQRQNAGMAIAALRLAGLHLTEDQVRRGLAEVRWPGRFQQVGHWILDGAHNPAAVRRLVETWRSRFGERKAVAVFGAAREKEVHQMLELLAPIVKEWRFVAFQSPRALPPETLAQMWRGLGLHPQQVEVYQRVDAALADLSDCLTLITGSLFLVGEILASAEPKIQKFRASAQ